MKTKNPRLPKTKIRNILVPLDGSKNSIRALNQAINLSKFTNSKIIGINIMPTEISSLPLVDLLKPLSSLQPVGYEAKLEKEGQKILESASLRCRQNNINFSSKLIKGNPSYAIVKFVNNKKNSVDLIVIGSRGRGHAEEILLGSVSYHVLHKSKIPIIIVK